MKWYEVAAVVVLALSACINLLASWKHERDTVDRIVVSACTGNGYTPNYSEPPRYFDARGQDGGLTLVVCAPGIEGDDLDFKGRLGYRPPRK